MTRASQNYSKLEMQHLLELFPLNVLRQRWPDLKGKKAELCQQIAVTAGKDVLQAFVASELSCCKQHLFFFANPGGTELDLSETMPSATPIGRAGNAETYLTKVTFHVVLLNPFQEREVSLLWPLRIQRLSGVTLVSLVVLRRSVASFFDRPPVSIRRSLEESDVLTAVNAPGLPALDFNKGMKKLWEEDYVDAFSVRYKEPKLLTTKQMDRAAGIKATTPALYSELILCPLYETMFRRRNVSEAGAIKTFQANPTHGVVRLTSYTANKAHLDELVQSILGKNR